MTFINWFAELLIYSRLWKWIMPNPSKRMRPLVQMIASVGQPYSTYPEHLERPMSWYENISRWTAASSTTKYQRQSASVANKWTHQTKLDWGLSSISSSIAKRTLIEMKDVDALDTQYLEYTVQEGWKPLLDFLLEEEGDHRDFISDPYRKSNFPTWMIDLHWLWFVTH